MAVQRRLAPMLKDEDFEGLYKNGGRPPVSPKILALVSLLQTMDRIPDREAAYDATARLDWQVIFDVDPGWTGFDPSLLTVFRKRMLDHSEVKDVFDRALEKLVDLKLVRPEGKQRLDSTWGFGLLRMLSRLENLKEALRVALRAIEGAGKEGETFVKGLPSETWKRANKKMDLRGLDAPDRRALTMTLGNDIAMVSRRIEEVGEPVKDPPEVKTLRQIFEQNFTMYQRSRGKRGKKRTVVKLRDFTETPGQERISSPHEPEARCNSIADKSHGAIGYKIQVAEAAGTNRPNFITAVEVTGGATPDDGQAGIILEDIEKKNLAPANLHVDSGCVSRDERRHVKEDLGVDLVGPTQAQAAAGMAADPVRVPIERTMREFVSNGARRIAVREKRDGGNG
jgi:transposase